MDPDSMAKAFVQHYYTTFDLNRAALVNPYQDSSMLTFESQKFHGAHSIVQKQTSLWFQQCLHHVNTTGCQSSGDPSGMLVFVSGFYPDCRRGPPPQVQPDVPSDVNATRKRYLVRWCWRLDSDCTWLPTEEVQRLNPDLLDDYHLRHSQELHVLKPERIDGDQI